MANVRVFSSVYVIFKYGKRFRFTQLFKSWIIETFVKTNSVHQLVG